MSAAVTRATNACQWALVGSSLLQVWTTGKTVVRPDFVNRPN